MLLCVIKKPRNWLIINLVTEIQCACFLLVLRTSCIWNKCSDNRSTGSLDSERAQGIKMMKDSCEMEELSQNRAQQRLQMTMKQAWRQDHAVSISWLSLFRGPSDACDLWVQPTWAEGYGLGVWKVWGCHPPLPTTEWVSSRPWLTLYPDCVDFQ